MQRFFLFARHVSKIVVVKYLFIVCLSLSIISCRKDNDSFSTGSMYKEVSPYAGKTTIHFIDSSQVIINGRQLIDSTISGAYTFNYLIKDNSFYFFSNAKDTIRFFFTQSTNTLALNSCPPGIPCPENVINYLFSK